MFGQTKPKIQKSPTDLQDIWSCCVMRHFRFSALLLFAVSLIICATLAGQQPPAKKKPPSLETEDVVVNPLGNTVQTDPKHLTGIEIAGALNKAKSFRCYWISNYGNSHFEVM